MYGVAAVMHGAYARSFRRDAMAGWSKRRRYLKMDGKFTTVGRWVKRFEERFLCRYNPLLRDKIKTFWSEKDLY